MDTKLIECISQEQNLEVCTPAFFKTNSHLDPSYMIYGTGFLAAAIESQCFRRDCLCL